MAGRILSQDLHQATGEGHRQCIFAPWEPRPMARRNWSRSTMATGKPPPPGRTFFSTASRETWSSVSAIRNWQPVAGLWASARPFARSGRRRWPSGAGCPRRRTCSTRYPRAFTGRPIDAARHLAGRDASKDEQRTKWNPGCRKAVGESHRSPGPLVKQVCRYCRKVFIFRCDNFDEAEARPILAAQVGCVLGFRKASVVDF